MSIRFAYPVDLQPDETGRVVARVADLPGCVTDGADRAEALEQAADALGEVMADLMARRADIPEPSPARGRPVAVPDPVMAAKAALTLALRDAGLSNSVFANRLGVAENKVRKIGRLHHALAQLGQRLVITVEAA